MNDWQRIRPRADINMSVPELDQLILDLYGVRTAFLLLRDESKIDHCKILLDVAESVLIECWDFSNLQMNRSEAVARHLDHAVKRKLSQAQAIIRQRFEETSDQPDALRRISEDAAHELIDIEARIRTLIKRNARRFRYDTMTRVTAILEGDEYLIAEMERSERSKRSIESVTDDLDHDDEAETINDELNVDDRRLLQLLQDPYERQIGRAHV